MLDILADENIHTDIIQALKKAGYNVATVKEKKLVGSADEIVLKEANKENRVLLTADKDFGGIVEYGHLAGKGSIILLRYRAIRISLIVQELLSALKEVEKEFIKDSGLIVVLSEGRYRLHHYQKNKKA